MPTINIIDARFMGAFHHAKALYGNDRDKNIAKAREFLDGPGLSRYSRMKVYVLLSALLKGGEDANASRVEAEALWMSIRRRHPGSRNKEVDFFLDEMRICLDDLAEMLREEKPHRFGVDDAVNVVGPTHGEQVADVQAMMDSLALEQDDGMEID